MNREDDRRDTRPRFIQEVAGPEIDPESSSDEGPTGQQPPRYNVRRAEPDEGEPEHPPPPAPPLDPPRRRSRSLLRPTAQSRRADAYNARQGLLMPDNWEQAWRRRQRASPPRHRVEMIEWLQRWEQQEDEYMPAIEIRLMLRDLSRYVYFTMRQGQEIRPVDLEIRVRNAYFPGRLVRLSFINQDGHVLRHDVPLTREQLNGLTAYPCTAVGASDEIIASQQEAYQLVRKAHPQLLNPKVIKTLLKSQPPLAKRLLATPADPQRLKVLMISAAQRGGLAGLVAPSHMQGMAPKSGQLPMPTATSKPQQKGEPPTPSPDRPVTVAITSTAVAADAAGNDHNRKSGKQMDQEAEVRRCLDHCYEEKSRGSDTLFS